MSRSDLPVRVLQNVTHRSLKHSGTPAAADVETRRMLAQFVAGAACFDADHPDRRIGKERMKQTDRV